MENLKHEVINTKVKYKKLIEFYTKSASLYKENSPFVNSNNCK